MMDILETVYNNLILQMKNSFARPMYKYCLLAQPILYSIIYYMMFKNSGQDNFMSFVILGLFPFVISYLSVKIFFQGNVYIKEPLYFLISMILIIISFMGISLIFSSFFTLSRSARVLMNCI